MSQSQDSGQHVAAGADEKRRPSSVVSTRPLPLLVERLEPWNKWLHRVIHYWRYGYSHPDEDLLGVIDAVGDALRVQVLTACALLTGKRKEEADGIKDEIEQELRHRPPDFATLLGIEARINALYPPNLAKRRQWVIRERFERIASPAAFQYWEVARLHANRPSPPPSEDGASGEDEPEPAGTQGEGAEGSTGPNAGEGGQGAGGDGGGQDIGDGGPPEAAVDEGEADTQTLLSYIHSSYLMTIGREKAIRDLKRWLLMRFWMFLFWLIVVLGVIWVVLKATHVLDSYGLKDYWPLILGLFLVAAVGRAGATMSVIRRLQSAVSNNVLAADPIIELTALRTGKNEISLALMSSSIFALLLYAFFLSGIPGTLGLKGGLFPTPAPVESADQPAADSSQNESSASEAADEELPEKEGVGQDQAEASRLAAARASAAAWEAVSPASVRDLAGRLTDMANRIFTVPDVESGPAAVNEKCDENNKACVAIDDLRSALGLQDSADFFKLLIWAFIAGFAERFVPDMLDRVVSRARGGTAMTPSVVIAAQARAGGRDAAPAPEPAGTRDGDHRAKP